MVVVADDWVIWGAEVDELVVDDESIESEQPKRINIEPWSESPNWLMNCNSASSCSLAAPLPVPTPKPSSVVCAVSAVSDIGDDNIVVGFAPTPLGAPVRLASPKSSCMCASECRDKLIVEAVIVFVVPVFGPLLLLLLLSACSACNSFGCCWCWL